MAYEMCFIVWWKTEYEQQIDVHKDQSIFVSQTIISKLPTLRNQ